MFFIIICISYLLIGLYVSRVLSKVRNFSHEINSLIALFWGLIPLAYIATKLARGIITILKIAEKLKLTQLLLYIDEKIINFVKRKLQ